MCGTPDFDVGELRAAVVCNLPEPHATWLWTTIEEMSAEERCMFLLFVTGSGAVPAGGFAHMARRIAIVASGDPDALPISHTCFNALELPLYPSREMLRDKLLYAIRNSGATDYGMI